MSPAERMRAMIQAISPVGPVEATSIAVATGLAARNDLERRQRRLKWLSSLRTALGEDDSDADAQETRDEAIAAESRARIVAALATLEEMRGLDHEPRAIEGALVATTATASDLALKIAQAGERTVRIQAHLGAVTVRHLVSNVENDLTVNAA